ncbi:MAG: electron transport complex subunit RsxC [Thermodesulfobacteriota bacterium]
MKRLYLFQGGVHPSEQKISRDAPIEELKAPDTVIVPLSQHIGAPCEATVAPGDRVKKGDRVGQATGFVSVNIHAPISGVVKSIGIFPHPIGRPLPAVEIESDEEDTWTDKLKPHEEYMDLSPETLKEIIRDMGIVGMGGAAFPTHVKLSPPKEKPIDTLIINGAECEPYLTADHRLMLEGAEDIIEGARIAMRVLGVKRGIIAIESNKPNAIDRMKGLTEGIPQLEVIALKVRYPQGAEKQLIKTLLNREVPSSGGLPMDVGVIVQNVGTLSAIYKAIRFGVPLIERITTVTGSGVREPKNLRVRIGTPIKVLIQACGGFTSEVGKVIMGGPMMGVSQYSLEVPVVKGTSGILVQPVSQVEEGVAHPCIRCGSCVRVCPARLTPTALGVFAQRDMFEEAERYDVMDCIECGCCNYVCPAKIPLVQLLRYAKAEVLTRKKAA